MSAAVLREGKGRKVKEAITIEINNPRG